ncbi:MAG: hypothetical protein J6T41_00760 [Neisseriaceae bacterium]|nr:hypothetical protein [Neisseriaceae bacterium]
MTIIFSGCLKAQSKRYLKNNSFCRKAKQNNCSLLTTNCSLLIIHCSFLYRLLTYRNAI